MTEDTIFDLASLTKSVATTTAFLQLYEHGLVRIDEPVQTYLPDFNPLMTHDGRR
jgi:CubicO group peptidase (beta-lactamase class C family)